MHRFIIIILILLLAGCARTAKYYEPIATEGVHIHPGGGCTAPSATYHFNVGEGIKGFISAGVSQDSWGIYYGFTLEKGTKLKMLSPNIKIRSDELENPFTVKMPQFHMSVYGGLPNRQKGYKKYYQPIEELSYTGLNEKIDVEYLRNDTFQSSANINSKNPKSFILNFPAMLANGNQTKIPAIQFNYKEKDYLLTCVQ